MYTEYAEYFSSDEATVKTAREFWKELDWKEMEKGSLVGWCLCGSGYGGTYIHCGCVCLLLCVCTGRNLISRTGRLQLDPL